MIHGTIIQTRTYWYVAAASFSLLFFLPSCTRQHPRDMAQIDSLRFQAEDLVKAQSLMAFETWALGTRSNQDSLYRTNSALFTADHIKLLRRAESDEVDATQRTRLRYFRRYLTSEFIARAIAPFNDHIANIEATATVALGHKSIPYSNILVLLANEQDQTRRAALYHAADSVLDTLNTFRREALETSHGLALDLGYPSYLVMEEELKGFSLGELGQIAQQVLASTDSLYRSLLAEMVRIHLSLDTANIYHYDIGPLLRSRQFDRYFPSSSMVDVMKTTYHGFGVDLETQGNLRIDTVSRPGKNPRPACFAIDIPSDIRLSIKPIGGVDDYSALFHEMGHGQHFANTEEQSFEFKYLGEPTVAETFAFLSEYILTNQAWLRSRGTMPVPVLKNFVRLQTLRRLYYVRRYCAKVLYEMQLHAGRKHPEQFYAVLMAGTLGLRQDPSDEKWYLADIDADFYSASYLRAWFLEAQMNARLGRDFGINWFEYPQAGARLRSLWGRGNRLTGEELAEMLGYSSIAPDAWLAELKAMVVFSTQ